MFRRIVSLTAYWGLTLLASCTRVVDLTPEGPARVVVNCVLSEDSVQTLSLSLTDIATPAELSALEKAEVYLMDESIKKNAGQFIRENDEWHLQYSAVTMHTYRLSIHIPGREVVEAVTTMPSAPSVSCYQEYPGMRDGTFDAMEMGTRYSIKSLPDGPVWVMGMNYNSATGKHEPAGLIATSLISADSFNVTSIIYQRDESWKPIPAGPGYVGGRPQQLYQYVDGQPCYQKLFRIPPIVETGPRTAHDPFGFFSVAGTFEGDYYFMDKPSETQGYVLFVSVSEEYDRFLKDSLAAILQQEASNDYAALFSRDNIYTNVVNGTGVFGAKTEQKLRWNNNVYRKP